MKKFCEFLKEHKMKMIKFRKKKKWSYQQKSTQNHMKRQKSVMFVKIFENKYLKNKKCCKVRAHCHYAAEYRGALHSVKI